MYYLMFNIKSNKLTTDKIKDINNININPNTKVINLRFQNLTKK